MRNGSEASRGGDAYADLVREYPSLMLILGALFGAGTAVVYAFGRWRTRRILSRLECDRLRDIGLSHADLHNDRLDRILRNRRAADHPYGQWTFVWSWMLNADRCRKSLAALTDDQLYNLSEQGLKARREALHHHNSGCTCRTSGAKP